MIAYVHAMINPESLRRAADGFRGLVAEVNDDQWQLPTPCDDWSVRQLVGHVAAGCQMAAKLAAGGDRNEAIALLGVDHLGDEPLQAVDAALEAQQQAFERPGVETQVFHHPAGDMPGAQVYRFRLSDLLVHQWDLASAIGADDTLDPELVREVWEGIQPMIPMMATIGVFGSGPSGDVGDDAPAQRRLLDAMGRRS
jgi:uncharacterized protein (TIGR03086 family)